MLHKAVSLSWCCKRLRLNVQKKMMYLLMTPLYSTFLPAAKTNTLSLWVKNQAVPLITAPRGLENFCCFDWMWSSIFLLHFFFGVCVFLQHISAPLFVLLFFFFNWHQFWSCVFLHGNVWAVIVNLSLSATVTDTTSLQQHKLMTGGVQWDVPTVWICSS